MEESHKRRRKEEICLGPKRRGLKVECLAFADYLVLLAGNKEKAQKMLEKLLEISEKQGSRSLIKKTEYTEYNHDKKTYLDPRFGKVKRTDKLKYLKEFNKTGEMEELEEKERKI